MKEFIRWTEQLQTGHPLIDEQHHKLVEIINRFYAAFVDKKHESILLDILDELADYTRYHFSAESRLMKQITYAQENDHLEAHAKFARMVTNFQDECRKDPGCFTFRLMSFLQNWLTDHIMKTDKVFVAQLREAGQIS